MPSRISKVIHDKNQQRYRVRFTDDEGKRRTRSFKDQGSAREFRKELVATPGAAGSLGVGGNTLPKPLTPGVISEYDGSATWWDTAHGILATELLTAVRGRNSGLIELLKDAASAFASLSRSQVGQRDNKKLEAKLKRLSMKFDQITQAARTGTQVRYDETISTH